MPPGEAMAGTETAAWSRLKNGAGRTRWGCAILALVWLLAAAGCGVGNQFLFSGARTSAVTPALYRIPYEEFWFSSRDGTPLHGWMTTGNRKAPLVVYFHGNGGNVSDAVHYLEVFHRLGFPVCIFDYRGYGKSGGLMHREGDLYDDARGMLAFLARRGWRREAMIYYGQSLGAAVALQMACEAPPAGLVLESPFTSFAGIQKHLAPLGYLLIGWWSFSGHFDNLAKVGSITVPLLLIHGDRDQLIPVEMTRLLYEKAHSPKMLHIIGGGGHCDAATLGGKEYRGAWLSFLRLVAPGTLPSSAITP